MVPPETGNVEIIETIVIVVTNRNAHSESNIPYAGPVCYVRKGPVAVIVVESTFSLLMLCREIDCQRIDKVNVQVPIVIIIKKGDTAAHRLNDILLLRREYVLESNTSLCCDLCELDVSRTILLKTEGQCQR